MSKAKKETGKVLSEESKKAIEQGDLFAETAPVAATPKAEEVAAVAEKSAAETPKKSPPRATAESMATKQREISVSEFFTKNRHLLGFDNPRKALLTTVKEAVDNSLDACEEAGILPELWVSIREVSKDRFLVSIRDNGPGIVKAQIGKIFAKLLYGSKFHTMKQARGQQGIGISAAGMYGQLTTGKPVRVTTRTGKKKPAHYMEVAINTQKNTPDILKEEDLPDWIQDQGTEVVIELTGKYQRGRTSVDEYLQQTSIANPHLTLHYEAPDGQKIECERASQEMPPAPKEIQPHPYGVEIGMLIKMLQSTESKKVGAFLQSDFSRISGRVAHEICEKAKINSLAWVKSVTREECERLYQAIQETKIMAPPTDCVSPIGEELIQKSLQAQFKADLFFSVTRPPAVYRGNPFVIEVGCAWGGSLEREEDGDEKDNGPQPAVTLRLANRVPLQHQPAACCITRSIVGVNWRNYGLVQPRGGLPCGPLVLIVHIASVWVPFTNEAKEAIASYPEIEREITLALQDVGRRLSQHIRRAKRDAEIAKKKSYITKYIPHIAIGLQEILGFNDKEKAGLEEQLVDMLERTHLQV